MDFTLSDDQAALAGAIDRLAVGFETVPTEFDGFSLPGDALERELEQGQYFDIALIPEMGPVTAALAALGGDTCDFGDIRHLPRNSACNCLRICNWPLARSACLADGFRMARNYLSRLHKRRLERLAGRRTIVGTS